MLSCFSRLHFGGWPKKNNLPQMESDGATEDPGGNAEATPLRVKPCRPKSDQQGVAADSSKVLDDCIICCSNPIDCVIIPCGHQVCCLQCSGLISDCPISTRRARSFAHSDPK